MPEVVCEQAVVVDGVLIGLCRRTEARAPLNFEMPIVPLPKLLLRSGIPNQSIFDEGQADGDTVAAEHRLGLGRQLVAIDDRRNLASKLRDSPVQPTEALD